MNLFAGPRETSQFGAGTAGNPQGKVGGEASPWNTHSWFGFPGPKLLVVVDGISQADESPDVALGLAAGPVEVKYRGRQHVPYRL